MKLEVSIGEVIDKLTILRIKSERILDENKLVFIKKELDIITDMVAPLTEQYENLSEYISDLYKVNCSLWDIENSIREKEHLSLFDEEFITLARSVYHNNDKRASIKYNINVYTNSDLREVKEYAEYKV